jgi:hypothetical protein
MDSDFYDSVTNRTKLKILKPLIMKLKQFFLTVVIFLVATVARGQYTDNELYLNSKHALEVNRDCDEALKQLSRISNVGKSKPEYFVYMGKCYDCKADETMAYEYYQKCIQIQPGNRDAVDRINEINAARLQKK